MKMNRHFRAGVPLFCVIFTLTVPAVAGDTSAPTPRRGGTLHLYEPTDLRSLDPAIAYDSESGPVVNLMFRGLLDYDKGVNLIPGQAKDWSISPDGKTYTFHLKPGIRFANGREVEAEDYVFSLERVLNPVTSSPGQGFFMGIQGAPEFVAGKAHHVSGLRAPDKHTLIIQLENPQFTFRYALAMPFAAAVPRDIVQRYGKDFQYHLIGSGPYRLAEWKRGVRWRLVRNPYYTGPDGYVDAVDIMIGGDGTTATMMLERNELDRVLANPPEAIRFEKDPRLRSWLVRVPTVGLDYVYMNTEMKPFDNVLVRRAVNYAINKQRLVKLTGDFATVVHGIVPPAMGWTNSGYTRYDYDPDKARELLREAGFPNGFTTTIAYMQDSATYTRLAEGIQQDLQQVGITANLQPANSASFEVESMSRHRVPLGVWGWLEDYPDPSDFLDVLFNGEHITDSDCNDVSFYNNPKVNHLLDEAANSINAAERNEYYRQAEDIIMNDAPCAPLISDMYPVLYNPRVHGTEPHPVWLWRYNWMWLDPQ